jgi:ankyrin repeat protein
MALPFELHREVNRGNTARVRELLRDGAELNRTDRAGYTPLMYALVSPAAPVELVQLLLERGGAVAEETSQLDGTHYNIAAVCLRGGDPKKLTLVLKHGADLHYTRGPGYDALLDAVFGLNADRDPQLLDVLRILIARGVALNGVSSYQETALRVLSRVGRFDAIQLLLDAGADEAQLAWTPLHRAVALGGIADVKALARHSEHVESVDWWERTPWLVAVKTGDLEKARYLVDCGADLTVTGRGGASPLDLAIESFHTPMLKWLIELGVSVESAADCCITPLIAAVQSGNAEAVDVLIAAGAYVDRRTACGTALGSVQTREIAPRLLDSGADPAEISFVGRRAIVGLEPGPDESLFNATSDDYRVAPAAYWGGHNPELMDQAFWQAMIRSGISAYEGAQLAGGTPEDCPVWCAQRFGQSLTLLPDGRAIQIGGEHEDSYDPDFCIYNDVFVHHPDGRIDIFCYPEDVFPPTDFHTATLIGDSIYIIGGLGYRGSRSFGETPVHRLDTHTLQIRCVETTGDAPGWISGHRAVLASPYEIRIRGGKIAAEVGGTETYDDNHRAWILDVTRRQWRREVLPG